MPHIRGPARRRRGGFGGTTLYDPTDKSGLASQTNTPRQNYPEYIHPFGYENSYSDPRLPLEPVRLSSYTVIDELETPLSRRREIGSRGGRDHPGNVPFGPRSYGTFMGVENPLYRYRYEYDQAGDCRKGTGEISLEREVRYVNSFPEVLREEAHDSASRSSRETDSRARLRPGGSSHDRQGLPALTTQQKIFYDENGYILIENNVRPELLDKLTQRFIDICNGTVDHQVLLIMKDPSLKGSGVRGEYLINKLQDFTHDIVLWEYISNDNVVDVVQDIIGPNITAVHSMFINKPPNADAGASLHPLHQDMHYFPFRPAEKIVAAWTAVERVDENNGCLYVIPASHKEPLYKHTYPEGFKNKLYHGVQGFDHVKKQYLAMEKGDTVFFHPHLLHGSGPNKTKGFRKAISCHYADSNCQFIDVRGTLQEEVAAEVEATAKKLGLVGMNVQDIWKMKSRLVRGRPGNFQSMRSNI